MDPRYKDMPMGTADSVPLCVFDASWPGQQPGWICLVTGQRRVEWQREREENRASERRAMKEFRAWRKRIYERSLAAIRLLDLSYLPKVEHPYRPGEIAYDIELPLRDRHGMKALVAHPSNVEELEEAIEQWFAALTRPTRAAEFPAGVVSEGDEAECVRVANEYVKKIFHEDLPIEQRDALLVAIFRCKWFHIPSGKLRNYFRGVMRNAATRRYRTAPIKLGGIPVASLDEPLPRDPTATLRDTIEDPHSVAEDKEEIEEQWKGLWQFCGSIPPSQPKLRRMAGILLELLDEKEAVRRYGRGGSAQLKRLKREVRAWRKDRGEATG